MAVDGDRSRGRIRPLPLRRDDDYVRQPGLDRATDAGRLPGGLPLRAGPAGGGRRRDGRRLRADLRPPGAGQPAHRAGCRQCDGGDLQRPGQPLAAAYHGRSTGAGADDPAGEPDQPRRRAPPASAGQVVLRAAAGRRRATGAGPRRPPRKPAAARAGLRLGADGRLDRRGRRHLRPARNRTRRRRSRGRGARPDRRPRRAARQGEQAGVGRRARDRRLGGVGRGGGSGRAPAAAGLGLAGHRRRATWLSRRPSQLPGGAAAGDRPLAETLAGHDLVLVAGSSVFPYYPTSPETCWPRGRAWSRSPAIPTRRCGPRWETRSSPTSG